MYKTEIVFCYLEKNTASSVESESQRRKRAKREAVDRTKKELAEAETPITGGDKLKVYLENLRQTSSEKGRKSNVSNN